MKRLGLMALGLVAMACASSEDDAAGGASGNAGTGSTMATGGAGAGAVGGGGTAASGGSAGGGTLGGSGGAGALGGNAGSAGAGMAGAGASGGVAGSSGSGGSAGASTGGAGSGGTGGGVACPSGKGPSMVLVGAQCVDSTEVTNAHYAAFLAAAVPSQASTKMPAVCSWNSSYVPTQDWPATGKDNYPVTYVDWCDAYAYCQWAGKRLCGAVGGGSLDYKDNADPNKSQWLYACSGQGTKKYPYGDSYAPKACNGVDYGAGATVPVASLPGCEGGVPGLFDMSGNVWEWEDSCQGATGEKDNCRLRGGSFWFNGEADLGCVSHNSNERNQPREFYGIRCCAP